MTFGEEKISKGGEARGRSSRLKHVALYPCRLVCEKVWRNRFCYGSEVLQ